MLPRVNSLPEYFYEGWNFNFGNAAVTFDTAHLEFIFSQTLDVLPKVM